MPRVFGQVYCSIWGDTDFIALSAGAQRTYLMLTTQDNIQACGLLPLTLRRWAKTCSDKHLDMWLTELVEAMFIAIDDDTEELLVRTFTKYDGGHNHALRRKAVMASARAIRSASVRAVAVDELGKLGITIDDRVALDSDSIGTGVPLDRHRSATRQELDRLPNGTGQAPESQRFPYTLGDHRQEPEQENLKREPEPLDTAEPPSMFCDQHPNGTTDPCGPCGTRRRQFDAWHERDARQQADVREFARSTLRGCGRCNGDGFVEDHAGQLVERCDHSPAVVSA